MGNDEILESLRSSMESMIDVWLDTMPLDKPHWLERLTAAQFDRLWIVIVDDFLPYGVEERGKEWPGGAA